MLRGLGTAFGFLTRFGPAGGGDFAASVRWFPVVGLALGAMAIAPSALGAGPWVAAWLAVVIDLWATRGLHADGLADVADAWGSMAQGERFYEIMKDSRVGAFGVMGLFAALSGKLVLFAALFAAGEAGAAAYAFVLGRGGAVWLMGLTRGLARPGLGRLFLDGATPAVMAWVLGVVVLTGTFFVPVRGLAVGLVLGAGVVAMLAGLAKSRGAVNGDFLGACVVLCELAACLGAVW
jgi:adenosylcobinamide-GDP ribazoletransferase